MKKTISICIPVFNEVGNLPTAVAEVELLFKNELSAYELDLVVTDNASTDGTWQLIQKLAADRPHLRAFRFSRNFGYQNSVYTGLVMARGEAVVELDADLEDPPSVIPRFVALWEEGYEVVYGVRTRRHGSRIKRALFHTFYRIINRMSDPPIPMDTGDFRLLDKKVVEVLKLLPERNLFLRGLVSYLGFRQIPLPYERDPRRSGDGKISLFSYIAFAMDGLTAFSKVPLRLIGVFGGFLFLGSLALSLYHVISRILLGVPVPGWTTLVVLTLMLNGVTFIFLGVIGEYLSRIFDDAKHRPRVIIADSVNHPDPPRVL